MIDVRTLSIQSGPVSRRVVEGSSGVSWPWTRTAVSASEVNDRTKENHQYLTILSKTSRPHRVARRVGLLSSEARGVLTQRLIEPPEEPKITFESETPSGVAYEAKTSLVYNLRPDVTEATVRYSPLDHREADMQACDQSIGLSGTKGGGPQPRREYP